MVPGTMVTLSLCLALHLFAFQSSRNLHQLLLKKNLLKLKTARNREMARLYRQAFNLCVKAMEAMMMMSEKIFVV